MCAMNYIRTTCIQILFLSSCACVLLQSMHLYTAFLQYIHTHSSQTPPPLTIVLSPHFDDAVLSLGGLLSTVTTPKIVATFFTAEPTTTMSTTWDALSGFSTSDEAVPARTQENIRALSHFSSTTHEEYNYLDFQYRPHTENSLQEAITKDIQHMIDTHPNTPLYIYGPAYFGDTITHPDHNILHDAFVETFKHTHDPRVHFYFYEDFPYVHTFVMKYNHISFPTYLEQHDHIGLHDYAIPLLPQHILNKESALREYTSQIQSLSHGYPIDVATLDTQFDTNHCSAYPSVHACERVYELVK